MSSRVGLAVLFLVAQIAILAAMPLAGEIGLRIGLRRQSKRDDFVSSQVNLVQATTFAMLGLLAAFSLAMAEERFSARRDLIRDESNAIGTAYLRSKYLPEPHRTELARLFREYVDERVAFYESHVDVDEVMRHTAESERIQREIWAHAVAVVQASPTYGDTNSVFVESLNAMIDLENSRVVALVTHVPPTVIALVVLMGLFACATTGLECGLGGRRMWLSVTLLPLLIGIATCAIIDLDSPRLGLIKSGQPAMLRLQQQIASEVPEP